MARFLRDVRDGNLPAVERALANNPAAIRAKEPGTERTALHVAAHNRQPDIIAALLNANAPSDAKDAQGAVPLHVAVATGDAETVAALLGRGAKTAVRFKNHLGYTPLHLAAKLGHPRVVNELLLAGANASLKDQRGKQPADLVPRVGEANEELVLILRDAAAESKAAGGASIVGSPGPRTPASRTPVAVRSTLSSAGGVRSPSPSVTPTPRRTPLSRPPAASATRTASSAGPSTRSLGYQSSLQQEVVADQIEQTRQMEAAREAQKGSEKALRSLAEEIEDSRTAQSSSDRAVRGLASKLEEMEAVVESQRRAVEAAAKIANEARSHQTNNMQDLQLSLVKRQEQLTGEMRMKLTALEGRVEGYVSNQDDVQLKLNEFEQRLVSAERSGKGLANGAAGGGTNPDVMRKLEMLQRNLAAAERARIRDRQQAMERSLVTAPSTGEELFAEPTTPHSPLANGLEPPSAGTSRQLRKQNDALSTLQRQFAALESRFVDYQEAQAAMAQAEMETPDFMVQLRKDLESATSESGSGKSGSNSQSNSTGDNSSSALRSSENGTGTGTGGGGGGGGYSASAMAAIVAALEGLTKEVGKVRVRTAQLGERSHASDSRLGYLEEQVGKIRNKMRQIKQWFTLTDQGSAEGKRLSRSRSGLLNEATTQRMPERQGLQSGPSSLLSQRSISELHFDQ